MKLTSKSAGETIKYGQLLAQTLKKGQGAMIALEGDLGGGKTQFAKGIALGLGIVENVISPTFVIRRDYQGEKQKLFHYDFYRLKCVDEELLEGMREIEKNDDAIIVIEWADRVQGFLSKKTIRVDFKYRAETQREISLKFHDKNFERDFKRRIQSVR